ncbi:MAG TPA: glycosyltransferase [Bryobacteraceae bacterium]
MTIHNRYKFRGGEDEQRDSEEQLLAANGHKIQPIVLDNNDIHKTELLRIGLEASWSHRSYVRVAKEIREFAPDVVHIHNFFPVVSPSAHHAAFRLGVPVVQTLHNYRLLCPSGGFYRDRNVCEDCCSRLIPWPGVVHRCYRESVFQTGAAALMISLHRLLKTWQRAVTLFITVSEFQKRKFIENGFSESKMVVKPNFVHGPGGPSEGGDEFLFVGRLVAEKGISTLLKAMCLVKPSVRLNVVGDGPMAADVRAATDRNPRIKYLGRLPKKDVLDWMGRSRCLIAPSEWYEPFGIVMAEAFAKGTPVIASRIGAAAEIVDDLRTGFHFRPGDPGDLARVIDHASNHGDQLRKMREEARREYELKYTAERNYGLMMDIYDRAISRKSSQAS